MKHVLPLFLFSAVVIVGCDSKLFSEGDDNHNTGTGVKVSVFSDGDFWGKSTKGEALVQSGIVTVHSLEDFICLQRLNQASKALETIRSLEEQIKSSDATSPRTRELRKEIFETRTQLLGILSDIEDAKFILVP